MKIGVIGLGKLGLCLAAVLGQRFYVVGIDKNEELVERVNKKEKNILPEPGLDDLLPHADVRAFTESKYLDECEVIFCIVPTPSQKNGEFSDEYIQRAIKEAKPFIRKCQLFVIVSTVMPGTCEKLKGLLQRETMIAYNPEFIALGDVINGMTEPDFILVGEEEEMAGNLLKWIYSQITIGLSKAPMMRMDLKSAEIAKISLNAYITMKISFANVLGEIAEKYGADVDRITGALGCDRRIGRLYLTAGSAYGGPCFPRDNRAFQIIAKEVPNYAAMTDKINRHQTERIVKKIGNAKRVAIIGMTYKNGTPIREESAGEILAERLEKEGAMVYRDLMPFPEVAIFMLPKTEISEEYYKNAKNSPIKIKIIDLWRDKCEK